MTRKIKILHVVHHLGFAGMEAGVIKLANRLPENEFQISICVLGNLTTGIEKTINPSVRIVKLGKRLGIDLKVVWRLAKLTRELDVDIVHSHNWGTYFYAALAQLCGARGYFIHGEHGRDAADLRISPARRIFIEVSKRWVSCYTAVAQHLGNEFVTAWNLPRDKLVVLPNGVDTERFAVTESRAEIRKSLGIPEKARVIGTVGNIRPIKNFPTIFAAVSRLAAQYPDIVMVMCGGNQSGKNEPGQLEAYVAAQCAPAKAIVLNTRPDIERVLHSFDVFVNSSYLEGMSNAILEAMASRCPVIASDIPGNRELLEDGALNNLFPVEDVQSLVHHISALLDSESLRNELVSRQTALVLEKFSAQAYLDRYAQFYRRTVAVAGSYAHAI